MTRRRVFVGAAVMAVLVSIVVVVLFVSSGFAYLGPPGTSALAVARLGQGVVVVGVNRGEGGRIAGWIAAVSRTGEQLREHVLPAEDRSAHSPDAGAPQPVESGLPDLNVRRYLCDVVSLRDGGAVALGFHRRDLDPESLDLIRIDGAGHILWQRFHRATRGERPKAIAVLGDTLVVCGGTDDIDEGALLAAFDMDGNSLWHRIYDANVLWRALDVAATPDGGLAVAGIMHGEHPPEADVYWSDMGLMLTDGAGAVRWSRRFGGQEDDRGNAVLAMNDGCAVAGHSVTSSTGWWDATVWRVGGDRKARWLRCVGAPDMHEYDFDALIGVGDGFVAAGRCLVRDEHAQCLIARVDGGGELIWRKEFGGSGNDTASDLVLLDDHVLVIGTARPRGAGHPRGFIASFGLDGGRDW